MAKEENRDENHLPAVIDKSNLPTMGYRQLAEHLRQTGSYDEKKLKETQKDMKKITKDYKRLSKRAQKRTKDAQSLVDHLTSIKEAEGIKGKIIAAGTSLSTYARTVPFAGYVMNKAGIDDIPVDVSLNNQLKVAVRIEKELTRILDDTDPQDYADSRDDDDSKDDTDSNDKKGGGIKDKINEIYERRVNYLTDARKIAEHGKDKIKEYQKLDSSRADAVADLEGKTGKDFVKVDPAQLDGESFDLYQKIFEYEKGMKATEFDINEDKKKVALIFSNLAGLSILGEHFDFQYKLGSDLQGRIKKFLNEADPHVSLIKEAIQMEQLLVEASKVTHSIVDTFNEALEDMGRHAEMMAKNYEGLIPEHFYKPEVLINSSESMIRARKGIESAQQKRLQLTGSINQEDTFNCLEYNDKKEDPKGGEQKE